MGEKLDQWVQDHAADAELQLLLDQVADVQVTASTTGTEAAVMVQLKDAEGEQLEPSARFAEALGYALGTMDSAVLTATRNKSAELLEGIRLEARAEAQEVLDQTEPPP